MCRLIGRTCRTAPDMSTVDRPDPSPATPIDPPISTRGIVIGLVLVAGLIVGFGIWASTLTTESVGAVSSPPPLVLLDPVEGAIVTGRVALTFEVPVELRRSRDGWENGGFHVHAGVDGQELMPGRTDIERLPGNRYRWTLPPLPPGERTLRLFWSDARHRPLADGGSEPRRIEVR
jgi:hypothetical protein